MFVDRALYEQRFGGIVIDFRDKLYASVLYNLFAKIIVSVTSDCVLLVEFLQSSYKPIPAYRSARMVLKL